MRLDEFDDLLCSLGDVGHVLAMGELPEEGRGSDDDVDTIDTGRDGESCVIHVATDVGEDLGLESELADSHEVEPGLLGGSRGGDLDVVDTKVIESLGNLNLLCSVEEGIRELLTLSQRRLDDLEVGDIRQKVGSLGTIWVRRGSLDGILGDGLA